MATEPDIGLRRIYDEPDIRPQLVRRRPRITRARPDIDPIAAEAAAADLLTALKMDLDDPSLMETPRRMAQALLEMTSGPDFEPTTFPNADEYDELVLVQTIPVHSVCQHHMLPLVEVAHPGHLAGAQILGRSKFARMVDLHARRPQTQQRLTKRIAEHLHEQLSPHGVGVVIDAEHTCMSLRGARATAARTITSALFGRLRHEAASRSEFLSLTRGHR